MNRRKLFQAVAASLAGAPIAADAIIHAASSWPESETYYVIFTTEKIRLEMIEMLGEAT